MTVKELINVLQKVEDKNVKVGISSFGIDEYGYTDYDDVWIDEVIGCNIKNQEGEKYLVLKNDGSIEVKES